MFSISVGNGVYSILIEECKFSYFETIDLSQAGAEFGGPFVSITFTFFTGSVRPEIDLLLCEMSHDDKSRSRVKL